MTKSGRNLDVFTMPCRDAPPLDDARREGRRLLACAVLADAVEAAQAGDFESVRWLSDGGEDTALWADAAGVDFAKLRRWAWRYECAHRRLHRWNGPDAWQSPQWVRERYEHIFA